MKKIITILAAAFCLFSGMMFTGCDEDSPLNELVGPVNTWCRRQVEYKAAEEGTPAKTIDVYCYYATQDKPDIIMGCDSSGNAVKHDLVKGLNIVIAGDKNANAANTAYSDILGTVTGNKTPYCFKSFAEGSTNLEISTSDTTDATQTLKVKKTLWNVLYFTSYWQTYSDATFPLTDAYVTYEDVNDLKTGFSLSKILRKMAANKLEQILLAGIDDQQ